MASMRASGIRARAVARLAGRLLNILVLALFASWPVLRDAVAADTKYGFKVSRHTTVDDFDDRLGYVVYGWNDASLQTRWGTRDIGQGAGALAWLVADLDGDKKHELIQPWRNGNALGFLVYKWSGSRIRADWGTENMGQGYGALAWLTADIDGDGKAEIIQPWRNGSQLGYIVYGWDGSTLVARWGTDNVGQGYGALAWLTADLDGDGKAEIIQPWRNGSQLGLIVYGWDGSKLVTRWGASNVGQGYGALAWLAADLDGDGKAELIQPWRNGSQG